MIFLYVLGGLVLLAYLELENKSYAWLILYIILVRLAGAMIGA